LLFACNNSRILYLADVDVPIEPNLEEYVKTPEFDHQCSENAHEHAALSSEESGDSSDDSLWPSTPYEVPKIEANLYYAGVGPKGRGPKLIYRTSDDKFEEPHGPEAYARLMRIVAVPDSHDFGQNGMWDMVCDRVRGLLVTQQLLD
jgi:hypothetical protein